MSWVYQYHGRYFDLSTQGGLKALRDYMAHLTAQERRTRADVPAEWWNLLRERGLVPDNSNGATGSTAA